MSAFMATARHEMLSSSRERMPQALLIVFLGMVSVSSIIGWITNRIVTGVYEQVRNAGLTTAANPFAGVSSLSYARNDVIYIILIGALLAIVLGTGSILRGRAARTPDLVLSRPVDVRVHLAARLAGLALWLGLVIMGAAIITWVSLALIRSLPLSAPDTLRLGTFFALAWCFLIVFVIIGMLGGLYARRQTTALLMPIIAWSLITFVAPQLGTAALPVSLLNPVPAIAVAGGPFAFIHAVLGPLSLAEHLKTLGGQLLRNDAVVGNAGLALASIAIALGVGILLLLATPRNRLRSDLDD